MIVVETERELQVGIKSRVSANKYLLEFRIRGMEVEVYDQLNLQDNSLVRTCLSKFGESQSIICSV